MCQAKCKLKCERFMQFDVLLKHRESFWGDIASKAPNAKTRRQRIAKEIDVARNQYVERIERGGLFASDKPRDNLLFKVDGEEVCEKAFVTILGLADSNGQKSKMWTHEAEKYFGKTCFIMRYICFSIELIIMVCMCFAGDAEDTYEENMSVSRRAKRDHAYSYITDVVQSGVADRSAFEKQENSVYLPYRRLRFFYGEYDFMCEQKCIPIRATESTFRRAFQELRGKYEDEGIKIKFNSGKGKLLYLICTCLLACVAVRCEE